MQNEMLEMTAKEYLLQVRRKEAVIKRLKCDKKNLREILFSLGASAGEGDKVHTSFNNDRYGSIFAKIDEKDCLITKKLEDLIDFKVQVSDEISMLSDPKYIDILHKRYIQFHSFEQIAVDMGYSYRYVTKIHGYALLEFEKVMYKNGKNMKRCTNDL